VVEAIQSLDTQKKIIMYPSHSAVYLIDGGAVQLPIARSDRDYKFERWLPVVLWRTDMIKNR